MPKRILCVALLTIVLMTVIATPLCDVASDVNHECGGENCVACICILSSERASRLILLLGMAVASVFLVRRREIRARLQSQGSNAPTTLVYLKTKLSN